MVWMILVQYHTPMMALNRGIWTDAVADVSPDILDSNKNCGDQIAGSDLRLAVSQL